MNLFTCRGSEWCNHTSLYVFKQKALNVTRFFFYTANDAIMTCVSITTLKPKMGKKYWKNEELIQFHTHQMFFPIQFWELIEAVGHSFIHMHRCTTLQSFNGILDLLIIFQPITIELCNLCTKQENSSIFKNRSQGWF